MGIRTSDSGPLYQSVSGKQFFDNDVQTESNLYGHKKEVITATDGQILDANQSGAFVIMATGIDVLLPTPEVGLNYKFITTAAIGGTAATIKSTSDGSTVANIMSGIVEVNGTPTATTTQVDTLTFAASTSTEGDFIDIECLGVGTDGVAATATITVTDGDAASGMTEKETMTLIDGDGTSHKFCIVDSEETTVTSGTVLASDSDTGASTAGSGNIGAIAVAVNLTGSATTQNGFLVALKAAIEAISGTPFTVSAVPGQANGNQSITVTQSTTGVSGATEIDVSGISQLSNSVSFQQADGKWVFRAIGDAASSITAT